MIKNDEEHARAMARLEQLMDADPDSGTPEDDELEVLSLSIERYEKERFPLRKPTPTEAIAFRLDQMRDA